jgi:hypothetical protein
MNRLSVDGVVSGTSPLSRTALLLRAALMFSMYSRSCRP